MTAACRGICPAAAWNHRFPARMSRMLQQREDGQPQLVRQIAWHAQLHLGERHRYLSARKLPLNRICVVITRQLAGFICDIDSQFSRW